MEIDTETRLISTRFGFPSGTEHSSLCLDTDNRFLEISVRLKLSPNYRLLLSAAMLMAKKRGGNGSTIARADFNFAAPFGLEKLRFFARRMNDLLKGGVGRGGGDELPHRMELKSVVWRLVLRTFEMETSRLCAIFFFFFSFF